ncbi:GyrI-like domain-containing protein [Christiangramia aquimixticola]|uniref:GyrI-like domain-containing protein n=1 Tax=Christiangramia aquimixticola TaxID=1697558 RepID=UPI003AA8D7EC
MKDPEIKDLKEKKLIGLSVHTSLADDKTSLLWKRFMERKANIGNQKSDDLYSVQLYDNNIIKGQFNSQSVFEKWAAVEVSSVPPLFGGLKELIIPSGLYAVFVHVGTANEFARTANFIFGEWIPASKYELDDRPHFEVLDKDYKGLDDPESKEHIWIPIKLKT